MSTAALPVEVLPHGEGLPLPAYQTDGAAGMDLRAALPEGAPLSLAPMARALVPCGIKIALPEGFEGQVRPRSGLAIKRGLTLINAVGTIDSDYRGELLVPMVNLSGEAQTIARGERIAQLVIAAHARLTPEPVTSLDATKRGAQGFGSTGTSGGT